MVLVCPWSSPSIKEEVWLDTCRTFCWKCCVCRFIHTLHLLLSNLPLSFRVSLSSQFMGRWFEIAKLPAQFERGRCIESNFTLTPGNSIRVVSSEILWVFSKSSECKIELSELTLARCVFFVIWLEVYLFGTGQEGWAEENRRDWSHWGYKESGQIGNNLFLWWARCFITLEEVSLPPFPLSGFHLFLLSLPHSAALLPILDPVYRLCELRPGLFLYRYSQALPRGLCLDPGPDAISARGHHWEGPADFCRQ